MDKNHQLVRTSWRMTPTKQYQKLAALLRKQIADGNIKAGELLPSENFLTQKHQISRATVRQALSELEKEGFIEKQQGKGSMVITQRPTLGLLSFKGFTEVVGSTTHQTSTQFLEEPIEEEWPQPFFYPLSEQEKENKCIKLVRIRLADYEPVMLEQTFLPKTYFPDLELVALKKGSLFQTLHQQFQIMIIGVEQDIRAILADKQTAKQLCINEGKPLVHIYRRYLTNINNLYLYSSLFCNTEKFAIGSTYQG